MDLTLLAGLFLMLAIGSTLAALEIVIVKKKSSSPILAAVIMGAWFAFYLFSHIK